MLRFLSSHPQRLSMRGGNKPNTLRPCQPRRFLGQERPLIRPRSVWRTLILIVLVVVLTLFLRTWSGQTTSPDATLRVEEIQIQ